MSIRTIMVTDPTNQDYGRIAPKYLPPSVVPPVPPIPPQERQGLSYIVKGSITEPSQTIVTESVWTMGQAGPSGVLITPTRVGQLNGCQNIQIQQEYGQTQILAQVDVFCSNLVLKYQGVVIPDDKVSVQFYLDITMGTSTNFDANQQKKYPITTTNPSNNTIRTICPIIELFRSDQIVGGTYPPNSFYYSGMGSLKDWFNYAYTGSNGLIKTIDLYACIISTKLIEIVPYTLDGEYGNWNYSMTFSGAY